MDVIHTAVWVSDLEEARQFFVNTIGLSEKWSFTLDGIENVYIGGEHGEIQLRHDPNRSKPIPDRSTLDHIAVSVDDVDATFERIVDTIEYHNVVEAPATVNAADARVAFIKGPDNYVLELVENLN